MRRPSVRFDSLHQASQPDGLLDGFFDNILAEIIIDFYKLNVLLCTCVYELISNNALSKVFAVFFIFNVNNRCLQLPVYASSRKVAQSNV